MERLGNLFDKYRKFELTGQAAKQAVVETVRLVTKLEIPIEAVSIKGYEVFIKLPSKQKVLVLLEKEKILSLIREKLKNKPYSVN